MTKTKLKKLSAMAVSVVMAASMVGVAKAVGTFHTATASALTAVTEDATIGIGVDNQATGVQITNTAPATLTLSNVGAGSYVIHVAVTEAQSEYNYEVSAEVDNGASVDLVYDYAMGAFVGTVKVTGNSQSITLSTRSVYDESPNVSLTVNAYLASFEIEGTNYFGGVAIDSANPATLDLQNVPAGRYILNVSVLSQTIEGLPLNQMNLTGALNGGTAVKLEFATGSGAFTAVYDITGENNTITLGTEEENNSYVLGVQLVPYQINGMDSRLAGVRLVADSPAEIPLVNVSAADYIVAVDFGDVILEDDVTVTAMVNGGTAVTLEKDDNYVSAYTGTVTVSAGTTTLTISTTNEELLIATVSLTEVMTYEELPKTPVTLNIYEPVLYQYTVETSGYYAISATTDVEKAGFDIFLKKEADSFDSVEIHGDNFPTYLTAGIYFYEVTYTGVNDPEAEIPPVSPTSAEVTFAVSAWENDSITVDKNFYVPVPSSEPLEADKLTFDSNITAGEYTLSLFDIPMFMRFQGAVIYLHYGSGTPIALNENNGYSTNISISSTDTKFYFTTDVHDAVTDIVTLGLIVTAAQPAEPTTLNLFTANTVTLNAGETKEYFVENLGAGVYTISLDELEGQSIVVTSGTSENPIISAGESTGTLTLVLSGEAATATVALIITNESDVNANFTVTIQPVNSSNLNTPEEMTLRVNYAYSSYMQLEAGIYQVNLSNVAEGKNVRVFADGKEVYLNADNMGVFKVANSGYVNMAYIYFDAGAGLESPETTTVTSTVTTATGLQSLELSHLYTLNFTSTNRVVNYTMDLTADPYYVQLSVLTEIEGVEFMVLVDGEVVVPYGQLQGEFELTVASNVVITIVYNGVADNASMTLRID